MAKTVAQACAAGDKFLSKQEDKPRLRRASQFSLFEGDLVNRGFARLGIGGRKLQHILARMVILIAVTWLPMAMFSVFVDLLADATIS